MALHFPSLLFLNCLSIDSFFDKQILCVALSRNRSWGRDVVVVVVIEKRNVFSPKKHTPTHTHARGQQRQLRTCNLSFSFHPQSRITNNQGTNAPPIPYTLGKERILKSVTTPSGKSPKYRVTTHKTLSISPSLRRDIYSSS